MLHYGVAAYHGEINYRVISLNYSETLIYALVHQVVLVDEHPLHMQPHPWVVTNLPPAACCALDQASALSAEYPG